MILFIQKLINKQKYNPFIFKLILNVQKLKFFDYIYIILLLMQNLKIDVIAHVFLGEN